MRHGVNKYFSVKQLENDQVGKIADKDPSNGNFLRHCLQMSKLMRLRFQRREYLADSVHEPLAKPLAPTFIPRGGLANLVFRALV